MTLIRRIWCGLTGRWCPWEETADPTIRYLRRHRAASLATVRALQHGQTGNLFADQLRGVDEGSDDVARA